MILIYIESKFSISEKGEVKLQHTHRHILLSLKKTEFIEATIIGCLIYNISAEKTFVLEALREMLPLYHAKLSWKLRRKRKNIMHVRIYVFVYSFFIFF